MRVRIEYFGAKQQLLGAFHLARRLQPRSTAVLLCNPFGEEASRSHRTFRVLATQLERAGFSVLRFDYSGTGDSLGSSDGVSVASWLDDIELAAQNLLDVSAARGVAVVGLRLGATLAMLAAARGGLRPRHLVMWDPIVDGGTYLRELGAQHEAYMREELGASWHERAPRHPDGTPSEAFGVPISAELAAELAAIDLARTPAVADQVTVVSTKPSGEHARLRAHLAPARWIDMPESTAWNSDAALNAMVVPMDIVQVLVAELEKVP